MNKLLPIALLIFAHQALVNGQEANALLFGKITNSALDTLTLSNHYGQSVANTNQEGLYRFELDIKNPEFMTLEIRSEHFTIIFQGKKAEVNQDLVALSMGAAAPDFSFSDPYGKPVKLSDFKGQYVYVDVWNSDFVKQYNIWFNPRFILVDRSQNIVYLSAPRPTGDIESILSDLPGL